MDKSWIDLPRMSRDYLDGIDTFIEFAYTAKLDGSFISCPCRKCENRYSFCRATVKEHLYSNGFFKKYKNWTNHGESYASFSGEQNYGTLENATFGDDMVGMVSAALRNHHHIGSSVDNDERIPSDCHIGSSAENDEQIPNDPHIGPDETTTKYLKLLENANTELYPGCKKFSSLSFIVRLLHMKVLHNLTNKVIDKFLEFYHEVFPEGLKLPSSYYEAEKITKDLGFTYKTWDACPKIWALLKIGRPYLSHMEGQMKLIRFQMSIASNLQIGHLWEMISKIMNKMPLIFWNILHDLMDMRYSLRNNKVCNDEQARSNIFEVLVKN